MRFRRLKVNKDSSRDIIRKLNRPVVLKNSEVEKEHIITKIKRKEKFYTLCLSSCFLIVFCVVTLVVGKSYKYFFDVNAYESGNLIVEYTPTSNGIGDVITLDDAKIVEDALVKNNEDYKFLVTNNGLSQAKYKITIRLDRDFMKLDGCEDRFFNASNIKYNLNKGSINYLSSKYKDGEFVISEDVIPGNSTKVYSLNVWLDKNTKYEDKHFHGVIEISMIKA